MSRGKQKNCRSYLFPYYQSYERRLQTFKNWRGIANPRLLARAGFFSTDTADHVYCFTCGVGIKCWDSSCDPWTEHLKWRPKCEFLKTGYSAYNKEKLIVGYSSFEERLKSFTASWPGTEFQDPVQMANAGFFYLGHGDHVQCYCCNTHLRSWGPQDIPIQEHARWNRNCGHLRERLLLESKREKELQQSKQDSILKKYVEEHVTKDKKGKHDAAENFEDIAADCSVPEVTSIYDLGKGVTFRTEDESSTLNLNATKLTCFPMHISSRKKTFGGKKYIPVSTSITGGIKPFIDKDV